MTEKKDPLKEEPEIAVSAVPVNSAAPSSSANQTPIPAGHSRFYCSKCHAVRVKKMSCYYEYTFC